MSEDTPRQIFDPGGEYDIEQLDSMMLCMDAVQHMVSGLNVRPAAFREGEFVTNDRTAKMFSVLWDTGACQRSYISKELVDKNRRAWSSSLIPFSSTVRLADQFTTKRTKEMVRGVLSFVYDTGEEVSAEVDAVVWEMPSIDFILGLPDILSKFLDLFIDMLQRAKHEMLYKIESGPVEIVDTDMKQGEERVWTTGIPEEPVEEAESYVPVQFAGVLSYMETSVEEARVTYLDMIDSHIGPLLQDCVKLKILLKSDLAIDRFVMKDS